MLYGCAVRFEYYKIKRLKKSSRISPSPFWERLPFSPSPSGRGQVRAVTQHCIHPMQSAFPLLTSPKGGGIICEGWHIIRLRRKIQRIKYSKMQKGAYNRHVLML